MKSVEMCTDRRGGRAALPACAYFRVENIDKYHISSTGAYSCDRNPLITNKRHITMVLRSDLFNIVRQAKYAFS